MKQVSIVYFSDVLCVWAYVAERRVEELRTRFGEGVRFEHHFTPIFGCTAKRIGEGWRERGGYAGFADHVRGVCERFPHVRLHPDVWRVSPPSTSANAHLVLAAATTHGVDAATMERMRWRVRLAFFEENRDISRLDVLFDVAREHGVARAALESHLADGSALAALCRDLELRDQLRIEGSPTFVMNEGRQKLYGNVGYRVLEANVEELLLDAGNGASWC